MAGAGAPNVRALCRRYALDHYEQALVRFMSDRRPDNEFWLVDSEFCRTRIALLLLGDPTAPRSAIFTAERQLSAAPYGAARTRGQQARLQGRLAEEATFQLFAYQFQQTLSGDAPVMLGATPFNLGVLEVLFGLGAFTREYYTCVWALGLPCERSPPLPARAIEQPPPAGARSWCFNEARLPATAATVEAVAHVVRHLRPCPEDELGEELLAENPDEFWRARGRRAEAVVEHGVSGAVLHAALAALQVCDAAGQEVVAALGGPGNV
jgi:hypothetical protein